MPATEPVPAGGLGSTGSLGTAASDGFGSRWGPLGPSGSRTGFPTSAPAARKKGLSLERAVLYGAAFCLPFAAVTTHMITALFGLLALILLTVPVLQSGQLRIRREMLVPIALLSWMGLSLVWTHSPGRAAQAFALVAAVQILFFTVARIRDPKRTIDIYCTMALLLAIALVLICAVIMVTVGTLRPPRVRSHWVGPISTRAAAEATLLIPVMFYILQRKMFGALPLVLICALVLIGFLTQSRSGIAAVTLSLGLSFLFVSRQPAARLGILLCAVPVLFALLSVMLLVLQASGIQIEALERLLSTDFSAFLSGGDSRDLSDRTAVDDWGRVVMYTIGLDLINDFSLTGPGFFSVGPMAYEQFNHFVQAHNVVIIMLGELGLIGGTLGALYLFALWRGWWRIKAAFGREPDINLFVRMLAVVLLLGLMLAQYKTMQGNLMFFGAIGALMSLVGFSRLRASAGTAGQARQMQPGAGGPAA